MFGLLAQLVEQHTFNVRVDGSSPSGLTSTSQIGSLSSSRPRTPPFHGGNGGSNPPGDAIFLALLRCLIQFLFYTPFNFANTHMSIIKKIILAAVVLISLVAAYFFTRPTEFEIKKKAFDDLKSTVSLEFVTNAADCHRGIKVTLHNKNELSLKFIRFRLAYFVKGDSEDKSTELGNRSFNWTLIVEPGTSRTGCISQPLLKDGIGLNEIIIIPVIRKISFYLKDAPRPAMPDPGASLFPDIGRPEEDGIGFQDE